ncbi:DUF4147 domain-containing protein [Cuniculiplasma sp. SKW3]|uniref:DUF4147 domain-containing protein n=1 Tax=Cuniculiplasma sp. SKW3 TaxID=3400170 RepID=UPI003FD6A849
MIPEYSERRKIIENIILKSIESLSPEVIISKKGKEISNFVTKTSSYSIVAMGKASFKMCHGLDSQVVSGATHTICLSPVGSGEPKGFKNYHGNHPYPGNETFGSSKSILETLMGDESDGLLFLLSGGTSSLFEVPADNVSQDKYLEIMKRLIRDDYPINVINEVRCRLSKVKCGKTLGLTKYKKVKIMAISDVPGDEIAIIGSNPFYPSKTHADVPQELKDYLGDIWKDSPPEIKNEIQLPDYSIILSGSLYSKKLIDMVETEFPKVDFGEILKGNVRELAPILMKTLRKKYSEIKGPFWFTGHGESTATVTGNGRGGRNTYLSALIIKESFPNEIFSFLSFATDGADGNSSLAGFIVDENLRESVDLKVIDNYVEASNTAGLALECGTAIDTGQTGNNVSDVLIGFYGGYR